MYLCSKSCYIRFKYTYVLMSFICDPICGPLRTCEVCEGVLCLFASFSYFVYLPVSFSLTVHFHQGI